MFLDRDGTINVAPPRGEYVERPEQLRLLPGAAQAIAKLNRAGAWTAVVTNQRGVALGRMSLEDLASVHARMAELLASQGARLDAIYACPHGLRECDCRKPSPGMLLSARREHPPLDFAESAIVGDSLSDVEAGLGLGLRTILLGDREAGKAWSGDRARDLPDAVDLLLGSDLV